MTVSYECDVCETAVEVYASWRQPEGWHEIKYDPTDAWSDRLHACSATCLAELGLRLALDEQDTPQIAPEAPLAAKPAARRTRNRKPL